MAVLAVSASTTLAAAIGVATAARCCEVKTYAQGAALGSQPVPATTVATARVANGLIEDTPVPGF